MAIDPPPKIDDPSGEGDEADLARDMIDVHGADAARVARENARSAALAGQMARARRWLRAVGHIQRQPAGSAEDTPPCRFGAWRQTGL